MSEIKFVNESELPFKLEPLKRKNKDSDPQFAQITQLGDGRYQMHRRRIFSKVIDVIGWSLNRDDAIESAEHSARFFGRGFPSGRKPVIVVLGA